MKLGLIQIVIATILKAILLFPLLFINGIVSIFKMETDKYLRGLAVGEDVYGSFLGKYLFDFLFLKKGAFPKFGTPLVIANKNFYITISRVMAINYYNGTLTLFGRVFAKILIFLKDKAFNL